MVAINSSILLAVFALSAKVMATPPACLLAAVNTQEDPADLDKICGDDASKVQEAIKSVCGDSVDEAQSAFSSVCDGAGQTIPSNSTSTSGSGNDTATAVMTYTTMSYDSACSCNKTSVITTTAAHNATGMYPTSTPTGAGGAGGDGGSAGSASATGPFAPESSNGAVNHAVGSLAAAAIAVAGVVAAL